MRTRLPILSFLLLFSFAAFADEPMCGVGEERELQLAAHRERMQRSPIRANATPLPATLRDGAFYIQADEAMAGGGNLFDLHNRSLIFEPRGGTRFAVRRTGSQYQAPGEVRHDFGPKLGTPWHYVTYDLTNFTFPIFGRNVTRLYLTAFNEIEFDAPAEEAATQFDKLEAAVHRNAVLSPLMITSRKPRQLAYPQVHVRETASSVIVTWRSTSGETFGYDVQAELRSDGTVVYSYNSMREMEWGTPVLSPGFDPVSATPRRKLYESTAVAGVGASFGALGPMLDIRNVEMSRMAESDVLSVRVKVGEAIDLSKIGETETVRYLLTISGQPAYIDATRTGWRVFPLGGNALIANGATANVSGDTIEFFFLQSPADVTKPSMRITTIVRPSRQADTVTWNPTLDVAPRVTGNDLLATNGEELQTPIAEPFVLPVLDPQEVWARIKPAFAVSDYEVDAIAIYQNFYTDMIFYAGAYSMLGNAGASGIGLSTAAYGPAFRQTPNVLHMNHLTYNYNAKPETASQVVLHEFGHRWLYFFRFNDNGAISNALNPVSAHPAAYVSTPSAFPVFGENESSVMGGAVFLHEGGNAYRTRVANRGFSWMDLYLMGLAATSEVPPWYYLTGTSLRAEYWPDDNIVVNGEKKDVGINQVIYVHGERNPSVALSQKKFRVLFVLVTPPGKEASEAEVAKMNEWRALLERTFLLATGGRGRGETTFVKPTRRRATR